MHTGSVQVDMFSHLRFIRKWENLLCINMPYIATFVIIRFP